MKIKKENEKNLSEKNFYNLIFNKFTILFVIIIIISSLNVNQWISIIRILPGTKIHPEIDYDVYDLIIDRGFKYEKHWITTPDGYILQMIRLINPYIKIDKNLLKPILLHHGYFCSATLWLTAAKGLINEDGIYNEYYDFDNKLLINGSNNEIGNSLGFVLSANGYDVWLANYRGNVYSMNHTELDIDDVEFWKFSIDEMIKYDLPAEIDYILNYTNKNSLSYIGHSQGSLMMFSLMSINDDYTKKINAFIALSPVTYGINNTSIIRHFSYLKKLLLSYPNLVIFKNPTRLILSNLCQNILIKPICRYFIYSIVGMEVQNMIYERIPIYVDAMTTGTAPWNTVHLFQNKPLLQYFDYGININKKLYGQSIPPYYNYKKINSTKIALFYSQNDCLNHMDNVIKFKNELKPKLWYEHYITDLSFNHNDFLWSINSGKLVNKQILKLLQSID